MDAKQLMEGFKAAQTTLRDGVETHNGWLMSIAVKAWKAAEQIVVTKHHYTADGITAKIWLPSDKKYYRITIQEER